MQGIAPIQPPVPVPGSGYSGPVVCRPKKFPLSGAGDGFFPQLDSQADHRDPKNLGVVVTEKGRAKFSEAGIDEPTAHYKGKTVRVRGVVIRREERPYIEVDDPGQIELVK